MPHYHLLAAEACRMWRVIPGSKDDRNQTKNRIPYLPPPTPLPQEWTIADANGKQERLYIEPQFLDLSPQTTTGRASEKSKKTHRKKKEQICLDSHYAAASCIPSSTHTHAKQPGCRSYRRNGVLSRTPLIGHTSHVGAGAVPTVWRNK